MHSVVQLSVVQLCLPTPILNLDESLARLTHRIITDQPLGAHFEPQRASAKSRKSLPFFEASFQSPDRTSHEIFGFSASVGFIPAGQHLTVTIAYQLPYLTYILALRLVHPGGSNVLPFG